MKAPNFLICMLFSVLVFCPGLGAFAQGAKIQDGIPLEWMPWRDPKNPLVLKLEPSTSEDWRARRDTSKDPKREPGLVNPQRYASGVFTSMFPTFWGMPMAFNSEDLKAGKVDVAVFGSSGDSQYLQGGKYAANKMRALTQVIFFPGAYAGTDPFTRIEYFKELVVADYGNAAANILHNQRSLEELAKVIGEIKESGAIPIGIGGTHVQMYAWFMALAKHHGPKSFAMFHIDAHYDAQPASNGMFVHNGSMLKNGVELGLVNGEDLVSVGLRSPAPSASELKWMRDNKLRYHFMAEVQRDGFDKFAQRIFDELKGKKLFISVDMDGIDPADAPAVGTMAIGGIRAAQAARLLRGLAAQNEVIGAEFGEYNPLLDDGHTTTGVVMDRLIRATLAGIAARKKGITDPNYLAPEALSHGVE
jgi:arginase family enzyme